jgi:spore maturation protein SpmB
MTELSNLILISGKAGVELALFILLPVMIIMLTIMRLLEAKGALDWLVAKITPAFHYLGIPGIGVFALIQIIFVSFAAPVATLAMMDKANISRRHIAATLAMVLTCAQANVTFPMSAIGLNGPMVILVSIVSGLIAASLVYYVFARGLPEHDESDLKPQHPLAEDTKGVLSVINRAGKEAFNLSINAIPMLVIALLLVNILKAVGLVGMLETSLVPLFSWLDLPSAALLPIISKYIAGGTAMMGVSVDFMNQGLLSAEDMNRMAGFLIHPFDIVGVALFVAAGPRVASVLRPAIYGALIAILVRTFIHYFLVF